MKLPKIDFSGLNDISRKLTSPSAYSAYAVVGLVATTILAIAATRKDCKNEFEKNSQVDISEKEFTREEVIAEVKDKISTYKWTGLALAMTAYCIRKSNNKWIEYNGIINAYGIAARDKMARYRALAAPAVGAEVIRGLNGQKSDEGVQWFCVEDPQWVPAVETNEEINRRLATGEPKYTPRYIYFQSTPQDVIEAEYHLNRNFALRGSASVREFFAFLGILDRYPDEYEDMLGWDCQVMLEDWGITPWIDFEHNHTTDPDTGEVINMIYYTWEPGFTPDCDQLASNYGGGSYRHEQSLSGSSYYMGPRE